MTTNATAQRECDSAMASLVWAEELEDVLRGAACVNADNGYLADALRRAEELVAEMRADLQHVMDTYSPEECGL
jgi:hypothetical protein